MTIKLSKTRGIVGLVVVLLVVNVLVMLVRPGAAQPDHLVPQLSAGGLIKLDGPVIATTNERGDELFLWQLGRYVNGEYESVNVRRYTAY